MTNTQITPRTVTFKSLKVDFGHDEAGAMGTMYFGKTKVVKFFDDGRGGEWELEVFDKDLEKEIIKYLSTIYEETYLQTIEIFIDEAISDFLYIKDVKSFAKRNLKKLIKGYPNANLLMLGCYVFTKGETLNLSFVQNVDEYISKNEAKIVYEPLAKKHQSYADAEEVFFIKFTTNSNIMFLKLK